MRRQGMQNQNSNRNKGNTNSIQSQVQNEDNNWHQCLSPEFNQEINSSVTEQSNINLTQQVNNDQVLNEVVSQKQDSVTEDTNKISTLQPGKGLFVNLKINGVITRVLVDTGADVSIVDQEWLSIHLPQTVLNQANVKLSVASNEILPVSGSFRAYITPCNTNGNGESKEMFDHTLLVTKTLNCDVILGTDFMRKYGCNIDLLQHVFTLGNHELELLSSDGLTLASLRALPQNYTVTLKTVTVPANTDKIIPVRVKWDNDRPLPNLEERQFCFSCNDYLLKDLGLTVTECFVRPDHNIVNVLVNNRSTENVQIERGKNVGKIEEVEAFFHELAQVNSHTILYVNRLVYQTETLMEGEQSTIRSPDDLKTLKLVDFKNVSVSPEIRDQFEEICKQHHTVFSRDKWDLGECDLVPHTIQLKPDAKPVQSPPRRVPYHLKQELKIELQNMLDKGIIEESNSCWSSPLVVIQKKDSGIRVCVDLRKVNEQVYNETFPMTNIEDVLSQLHGKKYFTKLDLQSGFHQQSLDVSSRPIIAKFRRNFSISQNAIWLKL